MKRVILTVLAALLLLAQTPTMETWGDFSRIIGDINRSYSEIRELDRLITDLEAAKIEIIDDVDRRDRLIKILDVHPDYSAAWVNQQHNKLKTLRQYLEDNNYIQ